MAPYHLVHFNLAIARYPLDHPAMQGFVAQIETVNGQGAARPGFVWMLPPGEGDAASLFGSARALPNMTVWASLEDLRRFTYEGHQGSALDRRHEWFVAPSGPSYVLWWTPVGHLPTLSEAKRRLDALGLDGPTAYAFTFNEPFDQDGNPLGL